MVKVTVIGATGYAGAELMRILSGHKNTKVVHAMSKSFAGRRMSSVYPSFCGRNIHLEAMDADTAADSDIVFTCLPHGTSAQVVPQLLERGVRVVDLSGDFRYTDVAVYEKWYARPHTAKHLLSESIYGMPELYRSRIKDARLIGNPGCYTTSAILALHPLLKAGLISPGGIIVDAKSGATGAGRKSDTALSFCEVSDSVKAYGVGTHRHTSEIEQELSFAAGETVTLSFTPHLLPIKRGIISTMYAAPLDGVSAEQIDDAYQAYANEPFVRVYKDGLPELKHVVGSNNCAIGFVLDKRTGRLIVVSCIDNLIKGAAGQAVQNMNIMCGFEENDGLSDIGWYL